MPHAWVTSLALSRPPISASSAFPSPHRSSCTLTPRKASEAFKAEMCKPKRSLCGVWQMSIDELDESEHKLRGRANQMVLFAPCALCCFWAPFVFTFVSLPVDCFRVPSCLAYVVGLTRACVSPVSTAETCLLKNLKNMFNLFAEHVAVSYLNNRYLRLNTTLQKLQLLIQQYLQLFSVCFFFQQCAVFCYADTWAVVLSDRVCFSMHRVPLFRCVFFC